MSLKESFLAISCAIIYYELWCYACMHYCTEYSYNTPISLLQLKTYAKSQDSQSTAIHADDIAYTLSEDHMLHPWADNQTVIPIAIY